VRPFLGAFEAKGDPPEIGGGHSGRFLSRSHCGSVPQF
jgi:hypothetical protein